MPIQQCANDECGWVGHDTQLEKVPRADMPRAKGSWNLACPRCKSIEFVHCATHPMEMYVVLETIMTDPSISRFILDMNKAAHALGMKAIGPR
jgi:hypothetical protein